MSFFAEMTKWKGNLLRAALLKSTTFARPTVAMKEPSATSAFLDQNIIGSMIWIDIVPRKVFFLSRYLNIMKLLIFRFEFTSENFTFLLLKSPYW